MEVGVLRLEKAYPIMYSLSSNIHWAPIKYKPLDYQIEHDTFLQFLHMLTFLRFEIFYTALYFTGNSTDVCYHKTVMKKEG